MNLESSRFRQEQSSTDQVESRVYIKEWDERVLFEGTKNVVSKIITDFNGLPDVVMLPETSARPLLYVLLPVFRRLRTEHGMRMPKFYFFNVRKPVWMQTFAEEWGSKTLDTTDEVENALLGKVTMQKESAHEMAVQAHPEAMSLSRGVMKERAAEIRQREPSARFAVIDEFEAIGGTATELQRAFAGENLHMYSIFSNDGGQEMYSGYALDYADGGYQGNPHWGGKSKLTYAGLSAVGVRKEQEGVVQKYAEVIKTEDSDNIGEKKRTLREEMKTVGEKVADAVIAELASGRLGVIK